MAIAAAAVGLSLAAADADAQQLPVTVEFQAFAPEALDALPGDTVAWSNIGGRTHTVTSDTGVFDSGDLQNGQKFVFTFATIGVYTYHCIIHRGMVGEIDVRPVTLEPLPPTAVLPKAKVQFSGRTAQSDEPVQIQMNTGSGFRTVASATPASDGSWEATISAVKTARYRASTPGGVSETHRLLVINRTVHVNVTRTGVSVSVSPSVPYALVALQYRLRDRFGWWIVAEKRLDYVSDAAFRIRRSSRVAARVVLLGRDHWTPLAISRVFHTGHR